MRINCQQALLMVLISLTAQVHAFTWQDLWATNDQQGQALMDKKQFKEANAAFIRPDWRAASAFRAGDYEQAAKLYPSTKSEDGYYNQGNALAYLGKYQEAINAYDKTLAINPENKDALHNRTIVEKLLKKEKQQNQDKQNQDKQNQDKQNQDKQNQDKQNQDKQKQDKQKQDKQKQDKQDTSKQNAQSGSKHEQQQAKEQWLRLIPDDPGGLLREKFLRDHLRRQEGWD